MLTIRRWCGVALAAIVLMGLGPVEYLGWMGTSPHWSYIGLVSLCAVLPMAVEIEPAAEFEFWLMERLRRSSDSGPVAPKPRRGEGG